MIKNVIFDLDGTLVDTHEGILESVKHAAEVLELGELPYSKLLTFIGPPIQHSFMLHYGCDQETAKKAEDIFRSYYRSGAMLKAVPYEGIFPLCEALRARGIRMAVATYKREDVALALLKHFHFDEYCDPMHGVNGSNLLKKDIIKLCMEEMGASVENTVLVGDTDHDATGAREAGVPFLAVTYGFGYRSADEVGESIGVAETPMQIADFLIG